MRQKIGKTRINAVAKNQMPYPEEREKPVITSSTCFESQTKETDVDKKEREPMNRLKQTSHPNRSCFL